MDNKINLTLDDVKDFLFILGYTWKGAILLHGLPTYAEDFSQSNGERRELTYLKLHAPQSYTNSNTMLKPVVIDDTSFCFYEEVLVSDIDNTLDFELDQDLSEQWIKFLSKRYGKKYDNYIKDLCSIKRHQEIENSKRSLNSIRLIKLDIISKLKSQLNRYHNVEKWINDNQQLKK
jgi:hypothetical protein